MILLDTHVAVWLYAKGAKGVPDSVRRTMDRDDLGIAPIVLIELAFLTEIGRLTVAPDEVVGHLSSQVGLRVVDRPMGEVARAAEPMSWTRDPFDRLICGHASTTGHRLATADGRILQHFTDAFWD